MRKTNYDFAKRILIKKYAKQYPKGRDELTPRFLMEFGGYVDGPDEDDFDDFMEYENAKYSSEQWTYFCKLSEARIEMKDGDETAWDSFLNWLIEKYFPEFA